ncbi:MAG: hypothetical protein P8I04_04190 [Algibacter sp.]|uniref:hypothetical protein n=1 Tax=Algibacter sp. TaxID=1872428 RepID=UPI00260ABE0F|nr:hypothetical protein [Algibacter sp.]MDG1729056.1 hypothetical protein [Algibacter sp.]
MKLKEPVYIPYILSSKNIDSTNRLWLAIMSMDIIEVFTLLKDEYNYFTLTKIEFVKLLDDKFKKHGIIGDTEFYLKLNACLSCHKDEIICSFVGLDSGIGLGLYFKFKNNNLKGLEFCDAYGKVEDLNDYYNWEDY